MSIERLQPLRVAMIQSKRKKPRPGRLAGDNLEALRLKRYTLDQGMCVKCGIVLFYVPRYDGIRRHTI